MIFRLAWRAVLVVACVVGICLLLVHGSMLTTYLYFTVQSNTALAVYFGWTLWRRDDTPGWKGAVTLYILITGLVYHVVLMHGANPIPRMYDGRGDDLADVSGFLLHYVTPAMTLLDWVIFGNRGRWRWRHAFAWLAYPLAYLVFALVRGALLPQARPHYPYPFLDVDQLGYPGVARSAVTMALFFLLLGLGLVAADRGRERLGRRADRSPQADPEPVGTQNRSLPPR